MRCLKKGGVGLGGLNLMTSQDLRSARCCLHSILCFPLLLNTEPLKRNNTENYTFSSVADTGETQANMNKHCQSHQDITSVYIKQSLRRGWGTDQSLLTSTINTEEQKIDPNMTQAISTPRGQIFSVVPVLYREFWCKSVFRVLSRCFN